MSGLTAPVHRRLCRWILKMTSDASNERRRILTRSVAVMALVSLGGVAATIPTLYQTAFDADRVRLSEVAASRAALISAVARFQTRMTPGGAPTSVEDTLTQLTDAQQRFEGFGETGEFALARRDFDKIVFLLRQRHAGTDVPEPITWDSRLAEPMRRALRGESGTVVGLDYRGALVLAAYEPLPQLRWGVVAKIDVAEVRAPFVRAGLVALGIALLLVGAGAAFVQRLLAPVMRRIDESTEQRVEAETQERVIAQELTRESLSRTKALLDTAVDSIITIDERGIIESVNRGAREMFGYDESELVGRNVSMLMPEPYHSQHDHYLEAYAETQQPKIIGVGREVPCRRKDGSVFPGDLGVSRIDLGDRTLFTGTMRDLTALKDSENELEKAEQRVRAAEELASVGTLVAGLAHEIGTPMGVIQGHAKLLEKRVEGEKAQWRLQTIQEQIGRISRIIQSLLNMARPKASERVPVELEPLLETTLSFLSEKLNRRGVQVVREFKPTGSVTGDPERLQQLLLNLFLNAADAMPEGGRLTIALEPDGQAGAALRVGDTGTGIPPDKLERIFDAFYTSKEAGKGSGLGLMVANRIVADHGGTIEVASSLGEGTTFHIHLPWTPVYPSSDSRRGSTRDTSPH
jgi:PAS domain S-box-containing protein